MLGAGGVAIPAGPDRAPCWPPGFVGSITHTGKLEGAFAAAAVARATDVQAVGLDAEQAEPLGDELMARVLTDSERRRLDAEAASEQGLLAKLVFSAKEAFYKCQYPLTLQFLGFHDVEVELDRRAGTFRAILLTESGRFPRRAAFGGRFSLDAELILAGVEHPFND
jgi:4'-phosphopantetheinyl transferase EntD